MDVSLYDYHLPEHLIAQTPLAVRTQSKLLALNKVTGQIEHRQFEQLQEFLSPGDLLIANDTRVIPARLLGFKADTGAKAELLLLNPLGDDRWEVLIRPAKRLKVGARIIFGNSIVESDALVAVVEAEDEMGGRTVRFTYQGIFNEILDRLGQMPLPPYIKTQLAERDRYQTVYARYDGSAAAPTAGLHFTKPYLELLQKNGVKLAYITLHVGLGTFRPVSVDRVENHKMHAEYYQITAETAEAINDARARGKRIIAVGTTTARTLETAARLYGLDQTSLQNGQNGRAAIQACKGWTHIFLYPGQPFYLVDALLTNFHLPKSTLLMLISAMAGRESVLQAYREAVERQYRFFSFGDAMFIF